MGMKAHQMVVETPTRGRDRSEGLHQRRERCSTRGNLIDLYPGGLCPFHENVGLGRPMASPRTPYDITGAKEFLVGSCVPNGTCGSFWRPKEA
jgi:hypothetical protein